MTQAEYIQILLNDCGIDTRKTRNAWLSSVIGREVQYLDEYHVEKAPFGTTSGERSLIINTLKDKKAEFRRDED